MLFFFFELTSIIVKIEESLKLLKEEIKIQSLYNKYNI